MFISVFLPRRAHLTRRSNPWSLEPWRSDSILFPGPWRSRHTLHHLLETPDSQTVIIYWGGWVDMIWYYSTRVSALSWLHWLSCPVKHRRYVQSPHGLYGEAMFLHWDIIPGIYSDMLWLRSGQSCNVIMLLLIINLQRDWCWIMKVLC